MKNHLSFVIIGCGTIGSRHAEHIHRMANLIAVCDKNRDRAKQLSDLYSIPFFISIKDMLQQCKPDVVAICTPNGLHAQHTITSLRAGYHVVCEKPMAIKTEDCGRMMEEAKIANKQLFIVKQNRFNEAVVAVKELLAANRLGRIYSFQINGFWNRGNDYYRNSWHGKKDMDGGTLFTQFSHFIDILYWLLGDVAFVQSYVTNAAHPQIETEDTGVAILTMKNGAAGTLNYTVNCYAENMEGSFTLFGEKGTVKIGGQYLNTISYQNIEGITIPQTIQLPPNDYGTYKGSMSNHDKVYQNVIDVLCHNGTISTGAEEGLKTVEIIEKIYAAAK